MNEWLITLNVDHKIEIFIVLLVSFKAAIRTAFMAFGGHYGITAKTFNVFKNSGIIGGNYNFLQVGFTGLFVNPLDHGFAANIGQWFPWKAGRSKSSRNYSQYAHKSSFKECKQTYQIPPGFWSF